jgi:hypothetical protein
MTAVFVEIKPTQDTVEFVEDMDDILESEKCSCDAGDDNPY